MSTLLASASSEREIMGAIRDFYCGSKKVLRRISESEFEVRNDTDGKLLGAVRVRTVKGRWRFEMTEG